MADRSIVVRLRAEVADFKRGMAGAAAATREVSEAARKSSLSTKQAAREEARTAAKAAQDVAAARSRMADGITKSALAVGAGLGLSAKAAIDWESAWTGVTKTVDGSAGQMAQLEGELRGLTDVLPATHSEIAGVAEAAGQLGVARGDITGFTKTMIDLGQSTNLSADEAATSLAQISNVMGTMDREGTAGVQRLGSTLVALGNAGASTEREIVDMSTRIVGAAKLVGASESDVLALANAMASVGIESQLGGGVMSRVLTQINTQVLSTGERLDDFARLAGVSAQDFARKWKADPVEAFQLVVKGLAQVQATGGDTASVLNELGIKGTENQQVMLRLTGASDMLSDSITQGRAAWEQNSALAEEAGKRYETTGSQIAIARNKVSDAAITLGGSLAPSISAVADLVGTLADGFSALPDPIQKSVGVIGVVGSAGALAAVGISKVVAAGKDARLVMSDLASASPRAASGMGKIGGATAVATRGLLAFAAASTAVSSITNDGGPKWSLGTEQMIRDLESAGQAVWALDEKIRASAVYDNRFDSQIRDIGDAVKTSFDPSKVDRFGSAIGSVFGAFGVANYSEIIRANSILADTDDILAQMVSRGSAAKAAELFDQVSTAAVANGVSVDQLRTKLPQYGEALASATNQSDAAGKASALLAGDIGDVGDSAKDARDEISGMAEEIRNLGASARDARSAESDFQAAIDAATASAKEHGKTLSLGTEAGRENDRALRDIASSALASAAALLEQTGSQETANNKVREGRSAFVAAAQSMGLSASEARKLASDMGLIPKKVESKIIVSDNDARAKVSAVERMLLGLKDRTVYVRVVNYTSGSSAGSRSTYRGVTKADGGIVERYAAGGFRDFGSGSFVQRVPQIVRGGANILWGEPETSWEGYVSGHPAHRQRNKGVLIESARRLGAPPDLLDMMRVRMNFAAGGIAGPASAAIAASPAIGGPSIVRLHPADRALLMAVADRPIQVEIEGKAVGRAVDTYRAGYGRNG